MVWLSPMQQKMMNDIKIISTVVDEQRRITLPPALCREHGLMPGDRLIVIDGGLVGPAPLCGHSLMLFKTATLDRGIEWIEGVLEQGDVVGDI